MKNDKIKSADGLKYRIIAIAELVFILGIIIGIPAAIMSLIQPVTPGYGCWESWNARVLSASISTAFAPEFLISSGFICITF